MKAEDMFKALGYECRKSENAIQYFSECGKEITFIFELHRFYKQLNFISLNIDVDEFKAIHQQMKELGWLEEEQREETNLDHYKDEIIEECSKNLAVVKGRPKLCYKINCNDCDFKINQIGCHEKVKDWLNKPYEKQKYKLTQFEYDLLGVHKDYKTYNNIANQIHLFKMREKGYFRDVDTKTPICEILDNCEVIK